MKQALMRVALILFSLALVTSNATASESAPQLLHLERALTAKQDARDQGELPPEKYQDFVTAFRIELEAVMTRVPPNPENKGLHARILARLGPLERVDALAGLEQALVQAPESPPLLVAKGSILHEQGDFPAANALALKAWEASGRKDQGAWALFKLSEGRTAASAGTVPARLPPASDFARLEWNIPKRHDINDRALGHIRQATKARERGDLAGTRAQIQAAMNADPTSKTVQRLYGLVQDEFARRDEVKDYLERSVEAHAAGRAEESLEWARKAYDRYPNDMAYAVLEKARRNAERARKQAGTPKDAGTPVLPMVLLGGTGLIAYGGYRVLKSKGSKESEEGLNPEPEVAPDQARRNYVNSAVIIGTPIAIAALVYGGPIAWRAIAPTATTLIRSGQQATERMPHTEVALPLPKSTPQIVSRAPSALQGAKLREHLRQLQRYGSDGYRELEDGAIRYYGKLNEARTPGDMVGMRVVREWNPATGTSRTWLETLDRGGNIRIVRPETGAGKVHYYFNEAGEYIGSR